MLKVRCTERPGIVLKEQVYLEVFYLDSEVFRSLKYISVYSLPYVLTSVFKNGFKQRRTVFPLS